jgi:hypothetical protein
VSSQSGKTRRRAAAAVPDRTGRAFPVHVLAGALLVLFVAVTLANSMVKELGRDEHVYCTGGALLAQGQLIYRDFPYISHPPYHALLLSLLYRVLPGTHYLLVGRLFSVLCGILVLVAIVGIYRSAFGPYRREGLLFGLAAAALYLFNPLVEYASGYAWNHELVILCVLLSLWLFVTADFAGRPPLRRIALMGALLTVATCTRITTAPVELLFLLFVLTAAPGRIRQRMPLVLAFAGGALALVVWPLLVFLRAPQAMWLDIVQIPVLCARWLQERGLVLPKAQLTLASLTAPGYLMLLALGSVLGAGTVRRWSGLETADRRHAGLAVLLVALFFVIAYIPPAMWQQYLAAPVPFLVVAAAFPLAVLRRRADKPPGTRKFRAASALVVICTAVAFLSNPAVLFRSAAVLAPESWVPVRFHRTARSMAAAIPEPKRVLTLGPLYVLESGGEIYSQLASAFSYRVADTLTPAQRTATQTVGPATLPVLLREHPPSAVLVGIERSPYPKLDRIGRELEEPLHQAASADWRKETYNDGLELYIHP